MLTDDEEFQAMLDMKNEPLELDEREAAIYERLCTERVPRLARPLPIEPVSTDGREH